MTNRSIRTSATEPLEGSMISKLLGARMTTKPVERRTTTARCRGFSLIEVTMALGITAMVLVPLVALLPYSMGSMREAIDLSISSAIIEEITADAQLTEFDDLTRLNSTMRYYDAQGTNITERGGVNDAIYSARIKVPSEGSGGAVRLPGSKPMGRWARRIVVDVAVTRGVSFNFDDPENFERIESFTTTVARLKDTSEADSE